MRIVYIASSIIPSQSANSVHVMKMCAAIAKNGHEVWLIVPNRKELTHVDNVFAFYNVKPVFKIIYAYWPVFKGKALVFSLDVAKKVKNIGPDFIYGRSFMACYVVSKLCNTPIGYESHYPVDQEGKLQKHFFRNFIKGTRFKFLSVITNSLKDYYLKNFPGLNNRILVLPDASDPVSKELLEDQQKSNEKISIGYIGSFYKGRGIELIIELVKIFKEFEFHLVGGQPHEVEEVRRKIESCNNVFLYGYLEHFEAEKIRKKCKILLAPYAVKVSTAGKIETGMWMSPLKIFEYMATGNAIVCTDLPVLREVLNESNCVLVRGNDITAWVESLVRLKDNSLRLQLGIQAKKDFEQYYTWDARAKKLIDEATRA